MRLCPLLLESGRILPSADVIIVNRFKLEINMLKPSRNRHSVKTVGGRDLKGEEEGGNYGKIYE